MAGPLRASLISRVEIGPGLVDLRFRMTEPPALAFEPGQFVTLLIGRDPAGAVEKRSYSIASPATDGATLRFIVRLIAGGRASEFLAALPIGADVDMTGPHGFFVLDRAHPGDVVLAATGTGIAPFIPMLHALATERRGGKRLEVFWGNRHVEDAAPRADVEAACAAAGATLRLHLTAPPAGWTGGTGRISPPILDALPSLAAPTFYLCGNGAMIDELKKALVARGVDRKTQIRTEAFFG